MESKKKNQKPKSKQKKAVCKLYINKSVKEVSLANEVSNSSRLKKSI